MSTSGEPLRDIPPKVLMEPARGRRKARVKCSTPGCGNPVIDGHLTCRDCHRLTPRKLGTQNRGLWRELKACSDECHRDLVMIAIYDNCVAILNAVIDAREEAA